jgi:hypothetical protein
LTLSGMRQSVDGNDVDRYGPRMKFGRRFATAASCALATIVLGACAHPTVAGTGSLSDGISPAGSAGVGSAPPGLSPVPSSSSGHGSSHGSGNHGSGSSSSPTASTSPSTVAYPPNDYHVTATGTCAWDTNQVGDLYVNVEYTIDHIGPDAADPVPWRMSNDADNYNTSGTAATLPTTFTARTGGQAFSASAWPGHNVKFTMTISPTGTDSLGTDNSASITLKFPANKPSADLLEPVPCS